jgi:oxygen-dependent protoporphyrinogen oxidase
VTSQAVHSRHIAVLGGGISGLSAAHRIVELSPDARITLLERTERVGGVLLTVHEDGYQIEQSADNFITTMPWGLDLCKRLGLSDRLIQTNPAHRHTFVVRKGRLHKLPDGFLMMAPTRMWPMAITPILSPLGKLRAAFEFFLPPRRDDADESMAAFVRRRLGREVFERLVEPLVAGVYAADMERLSVDATLSQFREMELRHGSLIRAMRHRMKQAPAAGSGDSGARYSMFVTLEDGLSSMVDALAARLPAGSIRLNAAVERVERAADGSWNVHVPGQPAQSFSAVIVATPSHVAAKLLAAPDPELGALLGTIEHQGTAIVSVAYDRARIAHPLNGMGAVVPELERSPILAISFSSQKYTHRAPEGKTLLRVFAGGARRPDLAEMDDAKLRPLILGELHKLLGISGEPCYCRIAHWPRTMPQYHVGHKDLVARIDARVAQHPGLALAGNAFSGVGVPQCIHSGEQAAERVLGREES